MHRSLAKGTNTGSGSRSWGCRAVSLGDAVHAKVQSECRLFRAAGLLINGFSVDAARGGGGGHGRKVKLKEKAGMDEK